MIDLSRETEALAERLAAEQGVSVEAAIRRALESRARMASYSPKEHKRGPSPEVMAARRASIDRIVAEIAAMPILDPRSPREIMDDLNPL